jgi:hypothetical protein
MTTDSLYEAAMEVVDRLEQERLGVARLSVELAKMEYALQLIKAKIERGLIKKVGGEKRLGPTVEDRERIFVVAADADEAYREQLRQYYEMELQLKEARAREAALRDRLDVITAALKTQDVER